MILATRLRARLLVPSLLVLVGLLLAGSAVPVAGADGEADELANYSACVGPAIEPAGFGDVGGYPAAIEEAIDCLAHYRITVGTSTGDYEPDEEVRRWQMAVFLVRAAGPAGIVVPRSTYRPFKDIGDLSGEIRDAINELADLRIARGTTATTFSPHEVVTRRQMALFLARFLDLAPVGEGGVDIDDVDPDDELFGDIGGLLRSTHEAIRTLFEMGVTVGTSSTHFSPDEPVTRAQMAVFITRALAHTNARPAGITIQTLQTTVSSDVPAELVISVRDRHQRPVPDASIDLFYAESARKAFDKNGRCDDDDVIPEFGDDPCEIDPADETTDPDGNLLYEFEVDEDLVLWAWTGDQEERFDVDETVYVSVEFSAIKSAVAFLVTDDMHPEALKARYGKTVTFFFQLVDEDEDPVTEEGVEIQIRSEERSDGRLIRRRTRTYHTGPSGGVVLNFRIDESAADDDDDESYLELEILESSHLDIEDKSTVEILGPDGRLLWSDEDEDPTTLVLDQSIDYHPATSEGRGARNTVTATLLDQYGEPVRGELVHFVSDDPEGLDNDEDDPDLAKTIYRKTTSRRGQAIVRYYRDSNLAGRETIEAFTEDDDIHSKEPIEHYWVDEVPDDRVRYSYQVILHDEDRDTLVLDDGGLGLYVATYDEYDHFNVGNETETYESFKENLEEDDLVDVEVQSHDPEDVNSFTRYE